MTAKWDKFFLGLAKYWATASKDPSTKVGAVIANDLYQAVGHGYNGFPRGVFDLDYRYANRETKYQFVVHAEVNAIIQAGNAARGATLYVYPSFAIPPVCNECAKAVIQAGIKQIVGYLPRFEDEARARRWVDSLLVAREMLAEAGVSWKEYNEE